MCKELLRLWRALGYSRDGLRAALRHEPAFRVEVVAACVLIPLSLAMRVSATAHGVLIGSVLLILIVELLNTALEKTLDRLAPAPHDLTKYAKDAASAAVLLSLILAALTWGCVLFL
jgi:diacylglycerol kinase (ATP)